MITRVESFTQPTTLVPLTPGSYAGFAILSGVRSGPLESMIVWPRDTLFVSDEPAPAACASPHAGSWHDDPTDVTQYLKPDGRYSETRQGRTNAYEGHYWIAGDQIVYRDDLGFWAYGSFAGGILTHADFHFRRV